MLITIKPIYLATLLLISQSLYAEELTQLSANTAIGVPRVDVIGNEEQLLKTPSSATIIEQEELESSHVFTTNEALRKVPGLVLRDEEGFGMRLVSSKYVTRF